MSGTHALLSPSGFKALMLCPAKPAMERGLPDKSSDYADEGTAAHELAAMALTDELPAASYIGTVIDVDGNEFIVDTNMADDVQVYIDLVRSRMEMYRKLGAQVDLYVEQAVPIGHITGEDGAEGTADTVIIAVFADGRVIVEVIDLKFGRGVEVDASENPQLMLYALGAIEKFSMLYDFTHASMLISQPRIVHAPSEFEMPVPALIEWGLKYAGPAATHAMDIYRDRSPHDVAAYCNPHEDACRFCKAKGACPALAQSVESALEMEFTDLSTEDAIGGEAIVHGAVNMATISGNLGAKMQAIPLIEMWCKAIRAAVEKELLQGGEVSGFKLVQGKKGSRAWTNGEEVEAVMKSMRLKREEMYDFSLISPTSAEKLLKKTPKRWNRVAPFITQAEGKPSVAPVSDKRPALELKPIEHEFEVIAAEDVGDLV